MRAKTSRRDKNNKKLTDFFTQIASVSVPPSATSSTPTATTMPTTRRRPATRASAAAEDREYTMGSSAPPHTRIASTTSTRKRARSPESNNASISPIPHPNPNSPGQPTKMFKSDTPSKLPKPVIYVNSLFSSCKSSARRQTPLRANNNSLVASPSDSSKQVVCSSQSDEAELPPPTPEPRDFGKVVEGIHTWRQKTSEFSPSSSPHACEDAMEVDTPPSSPTLGSAVASARTPSPYFNAPVRSAATPGSSAAPQTPVVASVGLPSPPDSNELPPLPPTPKPIDPEAKTAMLIAEIRARAFAGNQSSDEEHPLEFRELDDSDDDDLIDDLPLIGNAKEPSSLFSASRATSDVFSSPLSSVPSTFNDVTIGARSHRSPYRGSPAPRPLRTSARVRRPAPAFRLPVTIAESSKSAAESKSRSMPPNRKKSQAMNPLYALLREKELEEKRGTSCAALRLAEEAIKGGSREASIGSHNEFDTTNNARLADEQAAWRAVRECRKSSSPDGNGDVEDFTIGDRESNMLGAVTGKAITKILAGDKDGKGKEKAQYTDQEMSWGVPLWIRSSDEDMEVDQVSTPLLGHPILTCIDGCLASGDDPLLDLILRTGVLAAIPTDILSSNIPRLLDMALFASSQIADAVSIALRHLWGLNPHKFQMPFAAILFVLVRLGASPSILAELGFDSECAQKGHVTHENFLEGLTRLLVIVKAAGFAGAFSSSGVANVVLILVIMGLDPLTSSELHTQLNITLDSVCNHGAADCLLDDLHDKVLGFAKQQAPVNKARLVSFFASGSGRTRCIARRLAYSLLVSSPDTLSDQALPLEPLILLLSPTAGSGELFDVTVGSTDYEELRHHVDLLSVALVDIAPYVKEERAIMRTASNTSVQGSPGKQKKPVPPLELLRKVLESLQNKIVDTRAAHLDRSRTKAAIQRLTMRICYDRMALNGVRLRPRASTLKAYFSPQRQ